MEKRPCGRRTPPFQPTAAHRKVVEQLIALHVTWDEIRQLIINPHSGEPVSKSTLGKFFKRELAAGGAELKKLAASGYFKALEAGEPWAIRMAMRNRFGWVTEGSTPVPVEILGQPSDEMMTINFVVPSKREPAPMPLDVTPPAYPADAQPDYTRPALEPPRPSQQTPTGAIWEAPPKPTDWLR